MTGSRWWGRSRPRTASPGSSGISTRTSRRYFRGLPELPRSGDGRTDLEDPGQARDAEHDPAGGPSRTRVHRRRGDVRRPVVGCGLRVGLPIRRVARRRAGAGVRRRVLHRRGPRRRDRALPQAPSPRTARPFPDDVRLFDRTAVQPDGAIAVHGRGQGRRVRRRLRRIRWPVGPAERPGVRAPGWAGDQGKRAPGTAGLSSSHCQAHTRTGRRLPPVLVRPGRRSTALSPPCRRSAIRTAPRRSCSSTATRAHGGTGTTC